MNSKNQNTQIPGIRFSNILHAITPKNHSKKQHEEIELNEQFDMSTARHFRINPLQNRIPLGFQCMTVRTIKCVPFALSLSKKIFTKGKYML